MKDELGDRMKTYEAATRFELPRRSYTIIRVDGKAFHTYTRGLDRPFDYGLTEDMDKTAEALCKEIMGAQFAYVQSDEISILVTDFAQTNTQAWFGNGLQKMCSISAAVATEAFNRARLIRACGDMDGDLRGEMLAKEYIENVKGAMFDSRVFQIPQPVEVENYFLWRYKDCLRNSISSVAQSKFSHKELHGKTSSNKLSDLKEIGVDFDSFDDGLKYGRLILKESYNVPATERYPEHERTKWVSKPYDKKLVSKLVPSY